MVSVIEKRPPTDLDRQIVRNFFYAMPLLERGKPLFKELLWVLLGRQDEDRHQKILPEYCYNIFDVLRKTHFKNFPGISDIIYIRDHKVLAEAKTIEDAKKVVQMDWRNLGRACGIAMRCWRFAEKEAEQGMDGEGFNDFSPEKINELFEVIFGKCWVGKNADRIASTNPDTILAQELNQFISSWLAEARAKAEVFADVAFQWSAAAVQEFHQGIAEGMEGFIDENSQLVGETTRTGTYAFLALAWPEIKAMLESKEPKYISDLHKWMLPFMRVEVTPYLDIDTFRDVCAPPKQFGIGLSFRR